MKTIKQIYTPFDLSSTRCYVAVFNINATGYTGIEHKLPSYIEKIKGIYVTMDERQTPHQGIAGFISLNFNTHVLKNFQHALVSTNKLNDCSIPFPFNESIVPNSFMQGYYKDIDTGKTLPFQIRVYLHYEPVL